MGKKWIWVRKDWLLEFCDKEEGSAFLSCTALWKLPKYTEITEANIILLSFLILPSDKIYEQG